MAANRWLKIIGALVLLLMLLVGSFSLGVYVGRHGWGEAGLRYQPGGKPPAAGIDGGPGAPPQGLPQGRPDLVGRLRGISPRGLELATQRGPRRVEIDQDTRWTDPGGSPLRLSDLRLGDLLAVYGELSMEEGKRLLAAHVVRLPPPAPDQP